MSTWREACEMWANDPVWDEDGKLPDQHHDHDGCGACQSRLARFARMLARFARMLADGHSNYSFCSVEEQEESLQELWDESTADTRDKPAVSVLQKQPR